MTQMWGLRVCGYCIHCGKYLASSSNTDDVSSNSSLEALQGLTHHMKGFILSSMSPLAAAAAAAHIMTVRKVVMIFHEGFKPEQLGLSSSCQLLRKVSFSHRCSCGHCINSHTAVDCVCCGEIPETLSRRRVDGVEVVCITLHAGFLSVCLNPWILHIVHYSN